MNNLIQRAREIVDAAMEGKRNPVIYFSGGKDSVVLVYLLKFVFRKDFAVLLHREPWHTHKYAFAEAVIRAWGLTCYDYPPSQVSLWEGKGIVAFTNYYQIGVMPDGRPATLALPKNILKPAPTNGFLCGLLDIIGRPAGTFAYPWDLAFIGHKSSDEDQIAGKVPLHADTVDNESGPRLAFPLRDWTDEDIWDFTIHEELPIQQNRYGSIVKGGLTLGEIEDKTLNSDYFPVCIACIDRREKGESVACPKLHGKLVPNQSASTPYRDIQLDYFGEKTPTSRETK